MVKRHNKGARRQILQLEDKKPAPGPSKAALRNIIHYSDSDEDSKKSPIASQDLSPSVGAAASSSSSAPLDSQVADFLKEIDALTVKEPPVEEETEKEPVISVDAEINSEEPKVDDAPQPTAENGHKVEEIGESETLQSAHPEGVYCHWQEICDDSTGYSYYWNTETNEVTWECPAEYLEYLRYLNSNTDASQAVSSQPEETQKETKKKKHMEIPEGAIIPISYFGGSSSDESSDEAAMKQTSSPCSKKQAVKTSHTKKKPSNSETSQMIGPQLPPDFQFPESGTCSPSQGTVVQPSKADPGKPTEVGPQLPPDYFSEHSEPSDAEPSIADQTAIASEPAESAVAPSHANGTPLDQPSRPEDSWEESLMNYDRMFRGVDTENTDEVPDSTPKKEPVASSSNATGLRSVVAYDSFTDEEEDVNTEVKSSSKKVNTEVESSSKKVNTEVESSLKEVNTEVNSSSHEVISELIQPPTEDVPVEITPEIEKSSVPESSTTDNLESVSTSPQKFSKSVAPPKSTSEYSTCYKPIDIDSMFAAQSSTGKFGFGFSRRQQLDLENDNGPSSSQGYGSFSRKSNFKSINFIRSDHVLDLNTLNRDLEQDSDVESGDEPPQAEVKSEVDSVAETPPEVLTDKASTSKDSSPVNSSIADDDEKIVSSSLDILNAIKDDFISKRKRKLEAEVEKEEPLPSCGMEIDADEIDKALSEALEKKKALDELSVRSTTPTVALEQQPVSDSSEDPPPKKPKLENDGNCEDASVMVEIVDLASVLLDKLSFLSSHQATLSTVFIQLQTRFTDWQAHVLDSKYFMERLQEVHQYLHQYETGVVSGEWTCQWDRENKRYFYANRRTNDSQWSFPIELSGKDPVWTIAPTDSMVSVSSSSSYQGAGSQYSFVSSPVCEVPRKSTPPFGAKPKVLDMDDECASPPPPPPGVDSPPPPPPPESPPPPPPESTEVGDSDIQEDMDLENSSDSDSLVFHQAEERTAPEMPVYFHHQAVPGCSTQPLDQIAANFVSSMGAAMIETNSVISRLPQCTSSEALPQAPLFPLFQNQQPAQPSTIFDGCPTNAVMSVKSSDMSASHGAEKAVAPATVELQQKPVTTAKKEKKKTKLSSGLALKKRNIPSLVQKWQKIKKEQEKEDKILT